MKNLVVIAALGALAACSQQTEKAAETDAAPVEAATAATESVSFVGDYDVKMADGKMGKTTINADGTYSSTAPDGKEMKGKFVLKDGKECFDDDGDEAEVCWTSAKPGPDGSFTSTNDKGEAVTVTPAKK